MKISGVLLSYQHAKYIEAAFRSALEQRVPEGIEYEVVVQDDASQDDTWSILERVAAESTGDVPVILHRNEMNLGLGENLYTAVERCSGEYILYFDGDDVSALNRLEESVRAIRQHPNVSIVYFDYESMDAEGNTLKRGRTPREKAGEKFVSCSPFTRVQDGFYFVDVPRPFDVR